MKNESGCKNHGSRTQVRHLPNLSLQPETGGSQKRPGILGPLGKQTAREKDNP
jgi:hypothetical protein